jgi:hypothetical protein
MLSSSERHHGVARSHFFFMDYFYLIYMHSDTESVYVFHKRPAFWASSSPERNNYFEESRTHRWDGFSTRDLGNLRMTYLNLLLQAPNLARQRTSSTFFLVLSERLFFSHNLFAVFLSRSLWKRTSAWCHDTLLLNARGETEWESEIATI